MWFVAPPSNLHRPLGWSLDFEDIDLESIPSHNSCRLASLLPLSVMLLALSFTTQSRAAESDFSSYREQQEQQFGSYRHEYRSYRQETLADFDAYRTQAERIWGRGPPLPEQKRWIEYQHGFSERTVVDFTTGTIKVELALPLQTPLPTAQTKLAKSIERLLVQPPDTRSLGERLRQPQQRAPAGQHPLTGLVADSTGKPLEPAKINSFAKQRGHTSAVTTTRGSDGKQRRVISASFPLLPNHLRLSAQRYREQITTEAKRHGLPSELVFAIIETESSFNPQARSSAPAYGLMQLVPTSGGRDAYQYLFGKDRQPTPRELYDPELNIRLGVAFLARIFHGYLKEIRSPQARLWCTIAAYNGGAGGTLRTFAPRSRSGKWRGQAIARINQMSEEQVFDQLKRQLPNRETRRYVQVVRKRMANYTTLARFFPDFAPHLFEAIGRSV